MISESIYNDFVTSVEVAAMLKLPERRVRALARRGEIPAKKLGKEWRFMVSEIVKCFAEWQPNTFDPNKKAGEILGAINGKKKTRV